MFFQHKNVDAYRFIIVTIILQTILFTAYMVSYNKNYRKII